MNDKQAVKIAIESMKEVMRRWTFDANLHAMGQVTPHTTNAAKRYKELTEAMAHLEAMGNQGRLAL